ncbi:MAG: metal-dependent hydrolase [Candidatus Micrarchaeota archaeon]
MIAVKTGFAEHFALSLLVAISFSLFIRQVDLAIWVSLMFFLGSFAPDVDHPKSIPRRAATLSVSIILFVAFIILFFMFVPTCTDSVTCLVVAIPSSCFASLVVTHLLTIIIPRHRGKLHSLKAALFFGISLFALVGISSPRTEALVLGAAAGGGYLFHLLVDFIGDQF